MADLQFSIRTSFACTLIPEPSASETSSTIAKTSQSPPPPQTDIFESKSNPSLKLNLATSFDENDEINVLKEKTVSDESLKILIPCIEKETIENNSIDNLKNINETVLSNPSVNIINNNSETILVEDPSSSSFISQIQSITAVAVATASSMTATTPTITIVYLPTESDETPDDIIIEEDEPFDQPQLYIITDKLQEPTRNDSITVDDLSPTTEEYQECMNFQKNVVDDDDDEYDLVTDGCNLAPGCVAPTPTPAPSIAPLAEVEIDPPDDEGDFEIDKIVVDEINEENDGGECSSFKPDDEKKKRKKRNSDSKKSDGELEQQDASKGNEQFAVCPWDEE